MATLATLAQYRMDYNDHMDSGWHWGMMVLMVLAFLAIVALVVWLVRSSQRPTAHGPHPAVGPPPPETPMQILDRRLASGEITPEEYRERAAMLGGR
jgi:putative membrane protein